MKLRLLLIAVLFLLFTSSFAQIGLGKVQPKVEDVRARIDAMGAYRAHFLVDVQGAEIRGYYEVEGDNFYIKIGGGAQLGGIQAAELYGDSTTRYMVDAQSKSVTIDSASDSAAGHILDNPNSAFDFTEELFETSKIVETQDKKYITFMLIPREGNELYIDEISLVVNSDSLLPHMLSYRIEGEVVSLIFEKIEPLNTPVKSFDSASYQVFDIVDFR